MTRSANETIRGAIAPSHDEHASRYRSGKSIVPRQWLMASLVLTRSGYRLGRRALRLSHLGDERRAAIYDFYLV